MRIKHKTARTLTAFLAFSLIFAAFCLPPFAATAYAQTSGDYEYSMNPDGTVTIETYTGTETELVIPSTLDGYLVTGINSFSSSRSMLAKYFSGGSFTSVTIPSSVTSIVIKVFRRCPELEKIIVEDGNAKYFSDDGVLYSRDPMTLLIFPANKAGDYSIPDGVVGIDESAFHYCTKLTGLTLPASMNGISGSLFCACTGMEQITVDDNNQNYMSLDGVLYSKDGTELIRCPSDKKSIAIPSGVTSIDEDAFMGCVGLTQIAVDSNNPNYLQQDGVLFSRDGATLLLYPSGKTDGSYTIPDGVTSIGAYAFYFCDGLASVDIPDHVASIGDYAFHYCLNLESAYFYGDAPDLGKNAFPDTTTGSAVLPYTSVGSSAYHDVGFTAYYLADHTGFESLGYAASVFTEAGRLADQDIAAAKALLPGEITVTEGTDTNLPEYFNAIPGMNDTGTTLSVTTGWQIIDGNGDIIYFDHEVTAQVTVHINKTGGSEDTKDVLVIIPAHTTIFTGGTAWYVIGALVLAAGVLLWHRHPGRKNRRRNV